MGPSPIADDKRKGMYAKLGVPAPFDTSLTLVTSPVLPPFGLAIVRLTFAVYGLFFILYRLIYEGTHQKSDGSFFAYFTTLSYIGLLSYFWAAGVQTLAFARSGGRSFPLQGWHRVLQFLHMLLFSTIATYPILVTIVFWALLASSKTFASTYSSWTNISEHALNTVFALFELLATNGGILSGKPGVRGMPWIHLPFLLVMLAGYVGVAYITAATQHFYVYSFLDPHEQGAFLAAYIVGIAVAEIVIFVLVRYLCILRYRLTKRLAKLGPDVAMVEEGMGRQYSYAGAEHEHGEHDEHDEKWEESGSHGSASPQL